MSAVDRLVGTKPVNKSQPVQVNIYWPNGSKDTHSIDLHNPAQASDVAEWTETSFYNGATKVEIVKTPTP